MRAEQRLWRTADGRLVADGDPDGAVLAYAAGDDIAPRDAALMAGEAEAEGQEQDSAEAKQARPAANKARGRTADK